MKKILAILLAFLLTGTLIGFVLTFAVRQAVAPAMREGGTEVSDEVIREEKQLATEQIQRLAELYGFEAEPVTALITGDLLKDLNVQAADWWSQLLNDGRAGEVPAWDTEELEQVISEDPNLAAMEDREQAEYRISSAIEEVRGSVVRLVLPMRQQTIRLGLQAAGKRVDLPSLILFLIGTPWALLALSALLAGLVALLCFRNAKDIRQYIGSALGAAAIVLVAVIILFAASGIEPMLREASASLAFLYSRLFNAAVIRAGALTLAMAALCAVMLSRSRKRGKTA